MAKSQCFILFSIMTQFFVNKKNLKTAGNQKTKIISSQV